MIELTEVSKTAIATLRGHVIESQKRDPLIQDTMAKYCLDKLVSMAVPSEKELFFKRPLSPQMTNHFALRARKYDAIANEFIARHPGCTVVNLGCGDTCSS